MSSEQKTMEQKTVNAETIMVRPINERDLIESLKHVIQETDEITYSFRFPQAVAEFKDSEDRMFGFALNNECVFTEPETLVMCGGSKSKDSVHGSVLEFALYKTEINGTEKRHGMFPVGLVKIPIYDKRLQSALGEPVSLKEFMGSRYQYNDRIRSNTHGLIDFYKTYEKYAT